MPKGRKIIKGKINLKNVAMLTDCSENIYIRLHCFTARKNKG
jgi:hypothetical protein